MRATPRSKPAVGRARTILRRAALALAAVLVTVLALTPSYAVTPYATTLPSTRIGTAALISPAQAATYYGAATTSTDGLAAVTGHATPTPPEIVELARALKNNADLIYAYVHDNIETAFMYGLQKGALGAAIDKSGTPFDQAALMVALLRQAGYTASLQSGTITLTGAQFYAWTGIVDSNAACQLLANGGIPAIVNGSTTMACATVSGSAVTSVQMSHIWVKVTISGSDWIFDPSYKPHAWKTQINLVSAMGFTAGEPLAQATAGMDSGTLAAGAVPYVHNLGVTALGTKLTAYATNLLNYLGANYGGTGQPTWPRLEDIAGGGPIVADVPPPGGWRQTAFAYTSAATVAWTGNIPDQYRTTLRVSGVMWNYMVGAPGGVYAGGGAWDTMFDVTFYADEIYGRALRVDDYYGRGPLPAGAPNGTANTNTVYLSLDNVMLKTYIDPAINLGAGGFATAMGAPSYMTLVANHPYAGAANGSATATGDYMDQTVTKSVVIIAPLTIVDGFGDTGDGLYNKWADERAGDRAAPLNLQTCAPPRDGICSSLYPGSLGDFDRQKMAAAWLAQYTRAAHLHGWLARAIPQLHHTLGFAYGDNLLSPSYADPLSSSPSFGQVDNFNRIDVDSALSVTSLTADAVSRRATIQAIAASAATLEGSVAAQQTDAPDTASTATRFEWGNAPPGSTGSWDVPANAYEDPSGVGPRKFLQFTAANASTASSLALVEGIPVASNTNDGIATSGNQPEISNLEAGYWSAALSSQVAAFTAAGFTVTASQEAFLGPGQRAGFLLPDNYHGAILEYGHSPTKQRGPALIATLYAANGDPLQIAHAVVALPPWGQGGSFATKGGGGGGEPGQAVSYNPPAAADILKSRFADRSNLLGVNLSTGAFGHTSPVSLSVGNGGFPYALSGSFHWAPGVQGIANGPLTPTAPNLGWTTNWQNRLSMSGSGREAFGASDVRAAVNTIATFYAVQDIYTAAPSAQRDVAAALAEAWWSHRMEANVITVTVGDSTRQMLQSAPGQWFAPGSSYAALSITGTRHAFEEVCTTMLPSTRPYETSRGWDYSGMSFALASAQGDVQHFAYWKNLYWVSAYQKCGVLKGFRLTNWSFPTGVKVNLVYGQPYDPTGGGSTLDFEVEQLIEVNNSLGRKIDFTNDGQGNITGFTNGLTGGNLRTVSLTSSLVAGVTTTSLTDPLGLITSYVTGVAPPTGSRPSVNGYGITQIFTPDNATTPNQQIDYDTVGHVKDIRDAINLQIGGHSVAGGRDPWSFFIADGTRGERDDPLAPYAPTNKGYTVVYDIYGNPARYIDELGRETDATFDGRKRVLSYLYPEHDQEVFTYDARNNALSLTRKAKPIVPLLPDITVRQSYVEGTAVTLCVNPATCNKPATQTNGRGFVTNIAWNATTGLPTQILLPTDTTGARPETDYAYTAFGTDSFVLLTSTTQKVSATQNMVTTYTYQSSNDYVPLTVAVDSTGFNAITTFTFDPQGNRTAVSDPRGNVSNTTYDADNRVIFTIQPDPDGAGPHPRPASKNTYDAMGRVTVADTGTVTDAVGGGWVSSGGAVTMTYDPAGNKIKESTITGVKQFSYDGDNRALCTTVRMNTATFGSLPADACTLGTAGGFGPDRIAKTVYDAAGQVLQQLRAFGTALQQAYVTNTWSLNGKLASVYDADGPTHITTYTYDGFDRLSTTLFADATHEDLTYVLSGALCTSDGQPCTRTNRSGQVFSFTYDNLDRVVTKIVPAAGTALGRTVTTTYDLTNKPLTLIDTVGNTLTNTYDTMGRLSTATRAVALPSPVLSAKTVSYQYDLASNRTRLTWDDGYYANYSYDAVNHPTTVIDSGGTTLATYGYDDLARRTSLHYNGSTGAAMSYTWSPENDLTTLSSDFAGTANDVSFSNSFTPAHQWSVATISNGAYVYASPSATSATFSINAVNEYPLLNGATALAYDTRGNFLGTAAAPNLAYDAENHLVGYTAASATYAFDPLGRRSSKTVAGTTTNFVHDGDSEIAEYDGSGALIRRFVPGPAIDDYVAMVMATGTKTFFHTDKMGSVIAMSDLSGNLVEGPYTYDSYGACRTVAGACTATGVPFRYTGQRLDAELNCLYYRARTYCPGQGRFYQTDPVGYTDDVNWYNYVGNDPTDKTDPSGKTVDYVFVNGGSQAQVDRATSYLAGSSTFAAGYDELVDSKTVHVTVSVDPSLRGTKDQITMTIDSKGQRSIAISWNPRAQLETKSGDRQSPALGLGHEIVGHADRYAKMSAGELRDSTRPRGPGLVNPDEVGATKTSDAIARQLGEPQQHDYRNVNPNAPAPLTDDVTAHTSEPPMP